MPYTLSITNAARQRPRARNRRYVELDEKLRKEMAIYAIDAADPHLRELESKGRIGEFVLACEVGNKMRKHYEQAAVEVLTTGNVDIAVFALTALLEACIMPKNEVATCILDVHDKGANRSKEEAMGYAAKDMPWKIFPDGTSHPRAEQGKYYARPKVTSAARRLAQLPRNAKHSTTR